MLLFEWLGRTPRRLLELGISATWWAVVLEGPGYGEKKSESVLLPD